MTARRHILIIVGFLLFQSSCIWGQGHLNVLFLDGKSGYVTLSDRVIEGVDEATVETWVKWKSFTKWSRVFDFGKKGNAVVVQSEKKSSTLNYAIYDRYSKRYRIQKSKAVELGRWYHVAAVCGSDGMFFYLDGELVGSEKRYRNGFREVSGGNNYLGKSNWDGDAMFHGYISEFRIWSEAKTQKQVQEAMSTQMQGNEPHLIAYWRFDKTDGNIVKDLSKQGNHAVITGKATIMAQESPPIALNKTLAEIKSMPGMGAYWAMLLDAYQDGEVTSEERQILDSTQGVNRLPEHATLRVEMEILQSLLSGPVSDNERLYYSILEQIHTDQKVSPNEQKVLDATKFRLGLSDERAKILLGAYHLSKTSN